MIRKSLLYRCVSGRTASVLYSNKPASRRTFSLRALAALIVLILAVQSAPALAEDEVVDPYAGLGMNISAESAMVIETGRGQELYAKGSDAAVHMPLLSKVMTALLTLERYGPDILVTISENAVEANLREEEIHRIQMETGKKYPVEYLITAMFYKDSHAAAIALAEQVSGEERLFVDLMNDRAEQLQLTMTQFVSSSGQGVPGETADNEDPPSFQYSTTSMEDAVRLAGFFIRNESFDPVTDNAFRSSSSLFFLTENDGQGIDIDHNLPYAWTFVNDLTGLFTGRQDAARSMIVTFFSGGFEILAVIVDADPDLRISDLQNLRQTIYSNYTNTLLVQAGQRVPDTYMDSVDGMVFGLVYKRTVSYIRRAGSTATIERSYTSNAPHELPLYDDTTVGTMTFTFDDGSSLSVDCAPAQTIYSVESGLTDRVLRTFEANPNLMYIIGISAVLLLLALLYNLIAGSFRLFWRARLALTEKKTMGSSQVQAVEDSSEKKEEETGLNDSGSGPGTA